MASIIKLKRSATPSSVPSTLQEGEIAVNIADKKLYVGGVNGGANVQTLSGDQYNLTSTNGSDSATITLTVDNAALSNDSITFSAGEGIDISESSGTITIAGEDASTSNKGVASFSSDNFAVSSGAVTIKDGGIVTDELADGAVTTAKISDAQITSAKIASKGIQANNIADGIITSAMISAGGITANAIGNDSVALGTKTTGNYVAGISGTANEITVSGSGSESATVTIGLPDDVTVAGQLNVGENVVVTGNTSIGGNLLVDGNLTVEGAVTYISSSTVNVDDSMLKLSANNAADTVDTGVYGLYIEAATNKFSGYFRDATDGVFKFYTGLEAEPTTTVNTGGTGYAIAQVDAIIDGGSY
jgi:hypothetical protein